jgi:hypothetical protein
MAASPDGRGTTAPGTSSSRPGSSFSLTVFRTQLTGRALSVVGGILGVLLAMAAYARLVFGRETVSDAYLTPFLFIMIWLFVLGVLLHRRSRAGVTTTD